ncbi:MAG: dihydropteroate synthase [Gemmatimonadales bacterium]|jgi:5-methyltetrahydrofolate--homocysteine methyltransferase
MPDTKLHIIGDLINNAYGRARKAFSARSLEGYQALAKGQTALGCEWLDVNIDGTQQIQVRPPEMLAFLPDLIPALQAVSPLPLCIDNPSVNYQRVALEHYDRARAGGKPPIVNSIAASRERLDEMIELVKAYDAMAVVVVSERFVEGGTSQCFSPQDSLAAARDFVEMLAVKAGRRTDQILLDPGLAPVGADTYGLVNIGLDAMRLIRAEPDLAGVHISVGLSNFAWGTPKHIRGDLEKAYLRIATDAGLDFSIANPESGTTPLPAGHETVKRLQYALDQGRAAPGEERETAGFRQAEAVMAIWAES